MPGSTGRWARKSPILLVSVRSLVPIEIANEVPILIEIVDKEEKINAFLPELDKMVGDGLITLEKVRVIRYRGDDYIGLDYSPHSCASARY